MSKIAGNKVARRYDTLATEYDEIFQTGYRTEIQNKIVFSTIKEFLTSESCRVLDAGGGTGFYSIPLAAEGHQVVVLDLSKNMLDVAETKAKKLGLSERVTAVIGDMESIELPDESFDMVLCHLALCHGGDFSRALSEFCRVLRHEGILSLIVENKAFFSMSEAFKGNTSEALKRFGEHDLFVDFGRLGRIRTFAKKELLALVDQTGFKPLRTLGLRIISDYLLYAHGSQPGDLEALEKLEMVLSQSEDWNSIGRFHFFICKKAYGSAPCETVEDTQSAQR